MLCNRVQCSKLSSATLEQSSLNRGRQREEAEDQSNALQDGLLLPELGPRGTRSRCNSPNLQRCATLTQNLHVAVDHQSWMRLVAASSKPKPAVRARLRTGSCKPPGSPIHEKMPNGG